MQVGARGALQAAEQGAAQVDLGMWCPWHARRICCCSLAGSLTRPMLGAPGAWMLAGAGEAASSSTCAWAAAAMAQAVAVWAPAPGPAASAATAAHSRQQCWWQPAPRWCQWQAQVRAPRLSEPSALAETASSTSRCVQAGLPHATLTGILRAGSACAGAPGSSLLQALREEQAPGKVYASALVRSLVLAKWHAIAAPELWRQACWFALYVALFIAYQVSTAGLWGLAACMACSCWRRTLAAAAPHVAWPGALSEVTPG
jgi:hypothetical protein